MAGRSGKCVGALGAWLLTAGLCCCAAPAAAAVAPVLVQQVAQAQTPAPGSDGFEPINELPPSEQMPAAPMVVAAYSVVMLAFFFYVLSLSRRLGAVKQDIARLEAEQKRSGRA